MELLELIKGDKATEVFIATDRTIIHSHTHSTPYPVTSLVWQAYIIPKMCYADLARLLRIELTLLLVV